MKARILRSGIHSGEEALVYGNDRSGMVVFSGCHLACSFCYTPETSVLRLGQDVDAAGFADILARLLLSGARNLNLISPTHVWKVIEPVLRRFKEGEGRSIPLVLKFSGFETPGLVERFARVADVMVPDFKVWESALATSVQLPSNYGPVAAKALATLLPTHGVGLMEQNHLRHGILVRHLLMPGFEIDSRRVIDAMGEVGYHGYLNLMTCFVAPKGRLVRAPWERVEALKAQAQGLGMRVLVDGKVPLERRATA